MFIDRARIYVEAGDGGDGMSSFRREKFGSIVTYQGAHPGAEAVG